MLTLTIKEGDVLKIGDDIRLVVREDTKRGRMTVAINAPRELNITRGSDTLSGPAAPIKRNM